MAKRSELHVGDRVRVISNGDEIKWSYLYHGSIGIIKEINFPAYALHFEKRIYNDHQSRYPESEYGHLIPRFANEDLELLDNDVLDDFNTLLMG